MIYHSLPLWLIIVQLIAYIIAAFCFGMALKNALELKKDTGEYLKEQQKNLNDSQDKKTSGKPDHNS